MEKSNKTGIYIVAIVAVLGIVMMTVIAGKQAAEEKNLAPSLTKTNTAGKAYYTYGAEIINCPPAQENTTHYGCQYYEPVNGYTNKGSFCPDKSACRFCNKGYVKQSNYCVPEQTNISCTNQGYVCTNRVRGCALNYTSVNYSCGDDLLICCENVGYCGDGILDIATEQCEYPNSDLKVACNAYNPKYTNGSIRCDNQCEINLSQCISKEGTKDNNGTTRNTSFVPAYEELGYRRTNKAMNIFIMAESNITFEDGDEVATFDENIITGVKRYNSSEPQIQQDYVLFEVRAWNDIPETTTIEGFHNGKIITFKLWDKSESKEYTLTAKYIDCSYMQDSCCKPENTYCASAAGGTAFVVLSK
ncbi:MAG: hypothetical protein WC916_03665 [Candidatus Woesearchaeota archaeon]